MPEAAASPRKKKGGLSCCSSRRKGSGKRGQRPGMRARADPQTSSMQDLPVALPAAAALGSLQPEADADSPLASRQRLISPTPPIPTWPPAEETLRPAASADIEEIGTHLCTFCVRRLPFAEFSGGGTH